MHRRWVEHRRTRLRAYSRTDLRHLKYLALADYSQPSSATDGYRDYPASRWTKGLAWPTLAPALGWVGLSHQVFHQQQTPVYPLPGELFVATWLQLQNGKPTPAPAAAAYFAHRILFYNRRP
jgi:hypothetical protein